jgi:ferredoxin, 2Fe-2S
MTRVTISTRDGLAQTFDCIDGDSLMENIRRAGLLELAALCGGNCSCGTCHLHVDAEWFARLPKMSEDENFLLDISSHRGTTSRLACQVTVSSAMEGLTAKIAAEDV